MMTKYCELYNLSIPRKCQIEEGIKLPRLGLADNKILQLFFPKLHLSWKRNLAAIVGLECTSIFSLST